MLDRLTADDQKSKGVVLTSSGNFAQAFAYAGRLLNVPIAVVMLRLKPAPTRSRQRAITAPRSSFAMMRWQSSADGLTGRRRTRHDRHRYLGRILDHRRPRIVGHGDRRGLRMVLDQVLGPRIIGRRRGGRVVVRSSICAPMLKSLASSLSTPTRRMFRVKTASPQPSIIGTVSQTAYLHVVPANALSHIFRNISTISVLVSEADIGRAFETSC